MPLGYNIFRNKDDDQREALASQQHYANEGITWHLRVMKARYYVFTSLWATGAACTMALVDYTINIFTDYNGILGWLFTSVFG